MGLGSPFRASHEMVAFVRGPKFKYDGPRDIRNVIDCYWPYGPHEFHNAEKPVELVKRLIAPMSGDTIVDPFMGSGTMLVAAKQLGRKAIGVELEEKYCEIAAKRLAQGVLKLETA